MTILGTDGNDVLPGTEGDDTIEGLEGDDSLIGGLGNDTLRGNAGNDTLEGGNGGDRFEGGEGDDLLRLGVNPSNPGDNVIGSGGEDIIEFPATATDGFYSLDYRGMAGPIGVNLPGATISKGAGTDTLVNLLSFEGPNGGLQIFGTAAGDSFQSVPGLSFVRFSPGDGPDTMTGSSSTDELSYNAVVGVGTAGVTVDLGAGTAIDRSGTTDVFTSIEIVQGTPVDDSLKGSNGDDQFRPLGGNDTIDGGPGLDTLRYTEATAPVLVDLAAGIVSQDGFGGVDVIVGGSIETVRGGSGNDTLIGSAVNDSLRGLDGDDELLGGDGRDRLNGEAGNDVLFGGDGDDRLDGQAGDDRLVPGGATSLLNDSLVPGSGNDTIDLTTASENGFYFVRYETLTGPVAVSLAAAQVDKGPSGTDTYLDLDRLSGPQGGIGFQGGAGDDVFVGSARVNFVLWRPGAGSDTITGSANIDRLSYREDAGPNGVSINLGTGVAIDTAGATDVFTGIEHAEGSNQDDTLTGSDGEDDIQPRGGNDIVDGGAGFDTIDYRFTDVPVIVDLAAGTVSQDGFGGVDTIVGGSIEAVRGGTNADTIAGDLNANLLRGEEGSDSLAGAAGVDTLRGEAGDDAMAGGAGNDTLEGGDGTDSASFSGPFADYGFTVLGDTILVEDRTASRDGRDQLVGVESLVFADQSVAASSITTSSPADGLTLTGGDGDDSIGGGSANDLIEGGDGDDTLFGLEGSDTLSGSAGNDQLFADLPGAGDDSLLGGDGDDTAFAGAGRDTVSGGAGRDFLIGDEGDDAIQGGSEDDVLFGGDGDDLLLGEDGVDFLFGDAGADTMAGGAGNDRLHVSSDDTAASGDAGEFDVLVILDNVAAGLGAIDLGLANQNASGSGPVLSGIEAIDASIATGPVAVTGYVFNGFGNVLFGSGFDDTIAGSAAPDIVQGNPGGDFLAGADGDDTLIADAGNDTLTGGDGADRFFYPGGAQAGAVLVTDYVAGTDGVQLLAALAATPEAALALAQQVGADVVLSFGSGQSITLAGIDLGDLGVDDFEIF